MNKNYIFYILILILTLFSACASLKTQYAPQVKDQPVDELPVKPLDYRFYLIGDAGFSQMGEVAKPLQLLDKKLDKAPENSAVVFLGNSSLPEGLVPEDHPKRKLSEHRLRAQLQILEGYPGRIFFIPGNRDWGNKGTEDLERMEDFIQDYLDRDDTFIPDDACSGPETEELTEITSLMAFDSQWWLQDWDKRPELNEDCEFRTKEVFKLELDDEFKDNRNKVLLTVMHHPIRSNGRHGGNYSVKDHIFPLTRIKSGLYLPLPGVGSLAAVMSGAVGSRQDLSHPDYRQLRKEIKSITRNYGSFIFASGHEKNLQYFRTKRDQHIIVSGSGSVKRPVRLGDEAEFVSGTLGFSILNIYEDGEVWLEFWSAEHTDGELLYRKKIRDPLPTEEELMPESFPEYETIGDSITTSILEPGEITIYSPFIWGKLHTDTYFIEIGMPVLDMKTHFGGMEAFRRGGGFQTNTLRLRDSMHRIYQIRSLEKYALKLAYPFNKTFARKIFKQQLTGGYPYGAFIATPMKKAIGVYHTNPKLVYVPRQPGMARFNEFGSEVYLMEERPDGDWRDLASFGNSREIVSTFKVLEERLENDKGRVDQAMVLRNRLFDNIIGDWDRHQDQWRWASIEIEGSDRTLYRPIGRDMDQAFSKFDGLVNSIAGYTIPDLRKTQKYDDHISKYELRWLNYNARNFDRVFLNQLTWEDWEREVRHIQFTLTDEVIESAVRWLPDTLFQDQGAYFIESIKGRRDQLLITARRYFDILNKRVKIPATHKDNLIRVVRIDDERTSVEIFEYEESHLDSVYHRIFDNSRTETIEIYGLDGDDDFIVSGKVKKGVRLRLIGGIGEDSFEDQSRVNGLTKRTRIFDAKNEKSHLEKGREAADKRTVRKEVNTFEWYDHNYNYMIPFPIVGFNPDDGFILGLTSTIIGYGFNREQIHNISAQYSFGSVSWKFGYRGEFRNILGKWDLITDVIGEGPQYVENYFGMGNETERPEEEIDYFRVRRERYGLYPSLQRRFADGAAFTLGPLLETVRIFEDLDNFLTGDHSFVKPEVFDWQTFTGIQTGLSYRNINNPFVPTHGIDFNSSVTWKANPDNWSDQFVAFEGDLTLYVDLVSDARLVWATRIGGSHRIGSFDFFQSGRLGGRENLRGWQAERFSGQSVFYHNNDLRIQLFYSRNRILPLTVGIAPGFDYGRVWAEGETSGKWHLGYGGGLWISPLQYFVLSADVFLSEESTRFGFQLGFQF